MLAKDAQICSEIVTKLSDLKNEQNNVFFLDPVDIQQFPDYKSICPKPRDLGTIKKKIDKNSYRDANEFVEDIRLCFNNGITYNKNVKERKFVATAASKMLKLFEKLWQAQALSATSSTSSSSSSSSSSAAVAAAEPLADITEAQRVLATLKKSKYALHFSQPVNTTQFTDYIIKVPRPMDLATLEKKLISENLSVREFLIFLRRIPANSLRYTASFPLDTADLRKQAIRFFELLEKETKGKFGAQAPVVMPHWNLCFKVIERILKENMPGQPGVPAAMNFLHPIASYYPNKKAPSDYAKKVSTAMDFGTCVSKLLEGTHRSVSDFSKDVRLVFQNCRAYWEDHDDKESAVSILELCGSLESLAVKELAKLPQTSASSPSSSSSLSSLSTSPTPPASLAVKPNSKEFRALKLELEKVVASMEKYKSPEGFRFSVPFLHPVDLNKYRDYLTVVSEPMDLSKIRRKVEKGSYLDPSLIKRDMYLMFDNARAYNSGDAGKDVRTMTASLQNHFDGLYSALCQRMVGDTRSKTSPNSSKIPLKKGSTAPIATLKVPISSPTSPSPLVSSSTTTTAATSTPTENNKPKKIKLKLSRKKEAATPSPVPEVSTSSNQEPEVDQHNEQPTKLKKNKRTLSPQNIMNESSGLKSTKTTLNITPTKEEEQVIDVKPTSIIPVPVSSSTGVGVMEWVEEALKIVTKLMRHDWASVHKPKGALYCFSRPVSEVFPSMAADYSQVIKKPMDLGTVESMLKTTLNTPLPISTKMKPYVFDTPIKFCEAVIRIFVNAIEYNSGKESSDNVTPLEICYAADHLAQWFTWMVLESQFLLQYHIELNPTAALVEREGKSSKGKKASTGNWIRCQTPLSHTADTPWAKFALTVQNRDLLRRHREEIVLESQVKDRVKECLRILKQLNMTNEKKYSWHFEAPVDLKLNPSYSLTVEHPTSRSECEAKLNTGVYSKMSELIEELRRVYNNALLFNSPGEASGNKTAKEICFAARWMQVRLEEKLRILFLDSAERILKHRVIISIDKTKIQEAKASHEESQAIIQSIVTANAQAERAEEIKIETQLTESELALQESLHAITGDVGGLSSLRNATDRLKVQSGAEQRRLEALKQERIAIAQRRITDFTNIRLNAVIASFEMARKTAASSGILTNQRSTTPPLPPPPPTPEASSSSSMNEFNSSIVTRHLEESHTPILLKDFFSSTKTENDNEFERKVKGIRKRSVKNKCGKTKFKVSRTLAMFSSIEDDEDDSVNSYVVPPNTQGHTIAQEESHEMEIDTKEEVLTSIKSFDNYLGFWCENGTRFCYLSNNNQKTKLVSILLDSVSFNSKNEEKEEEDEFCVASILNARREEPCLQLTLVTVEVKDCTMVEFESLKQNKQSYPSLIDDDDMVGFNDTTQNQQGEYASSKIFNDDDDIQLIKRTYSDSEHLWFEKLPFHISDFKEKLNLSTCSVPTTSLRTDLSQSGLRNHRQPHHHHPRGIIWPSLEVEVDSGMGSLRNIDNTFFNSDRIQLLSDPQLFYQLSKKIEKLNNFLRYGGLNSPFSFHGWLKPRTCYYDDVLNVWMNYDDDDATKLKPKVIKYEGLESLNNNFTIGAIRGGCSFVMERRSIRIEVGGRALKHPLLG